MKKSITVVLSVAIGVSWALVPSRASAADGDLGRAKKTGPLAEYVAREDANYGWTVRRRGKVGVTPYAELTLTSQTWRGVTWKHRLFVARPTSTPDDAEQCILLVAGGNWHDKLAGPTGDEKLPGEAALFAAMSEQLETPIAVLLNVPRQPIFDGKYEDQIIAFTFEKYLKTGDAEWPLLLPMVKSVVRGMDAVQEFGRQEWNLSIRTFTVTGASKRGWTTWLAGAVDDRVAAIAPMVIDVLNMKPQMEHQRKAWGDFSYKIDDYTERGLQDALQSDEGKALREIVDPFSYRKQLTLPKLILIGTNDHYWPLDALNLYWDQLHGEKYILYLPNNRHGLTDYVRIVGTLGALHRHAAGEREMPKLSWKFRRDADRLLLRIESDVRPKTVRVWTAKAETRDFRRAPWRSREVKYDGAAAEVTLPVPDEGFGAMFGEAVYDAALPYYLSTNVRIVQAEEPVSGEVSGSDR